ncbi:VOC family protein [Hamadaea tsunoensis]|uniref:VOC family protein n=1 Tax=Hamadaea tsunoensis TaxID=53368 RepID=UPI0003FFC07E|nr:VOC family protein [Hamadaea tsunoensis]
MPIPSTLDHIMVVVPDLAAGVEAFRELTGVTPVPGGRHPIGTANALVGLRRTDGGDERVYLELLGPDPDASAAAFDSGGRFLVGDASGLVGRTWLIHPADLDATVAAAEAAAVDLGDVRPLSRETPSGETLSWRLSVAYPLPSGGAQPALIDWGTTPHPSTRLAAEVVLESLDVLSPEPDRVRAGLAVLGTDAVVVEGETPGVRIVLGTPRGRVVIGPAGVE